METRSSRSLDPGSILGLVGGVLLLVGSLMTWATVSVNVGSFAAGQSFSGTSVGTDGKVALVCGVIVLIAAVIAIMATARTLAAVVLMLGGLIGGGIALYDGLTGKDNAIDEATQALSALGLPGDVRSFFDVSIGIGIWICVAGGALALVGGILVLIKRSSSAAMVSPSGAVGMGTGVPTTPPEVTGAMPPASPATPPMPPTPPIPPMDVPDPGSAPPTP